MDTSEKRVAIGSDHAGYAYKELIKTHLRAQGYGVRDFGTESEEPVDYPRFVRPVAETVAKGEFPLGIVLGGSGNGEAIVANKVRGIRCAVCWNEESARLAKEHNNANMISLGGRMIGRDTALRIVDVWLGATFQGGRHVQRLEQIESGT
jgi:ribose 5-phosphate isomerase B